MIRASIDLGTNTCLLLVAEWDEKSNRVARVIKDQIEYVRLGQGVDRSRLLSPEAIQRTRACLQGYVSQLRALGVKPESVIAVATSQARDAKNGDKFFGELRTELGLRFRTLSGDQEAELTFLGGIPDEMDPRKAAVIDIGGGSTEIRSSESGRSLDLGSVRFTERYLQGNPVTDLQYWDCVARVDRELEVLRPWRDSLPGDLQLVGVAGTVTTAACWNLGLKVFSTEKLNGTVLTRGDVHRFVGELKWRSLEERRLLSGIDSHRADVILAGAIILWRAMEVLRFPNVLVSTRGLRFGALRLSESPA